MLEELKQKVIDAAQSAEKTKLCRPKSGNFSAISGTRRYIAITPSGLDRMTLTPNDIIILDRNLKIIENVNGHSPSSESLMHSAVYDTRPDAVAVAHTHSPYALVFAILNKEVPPILVESGHLGSEDGTIPIAPYGRQGTSDLASSVRGILKKSDVMILAHHGVLTTSSKSLDEALIKAMYVEDICSAYYRALLLGGERSVMVLPTDELEMYSPFHISH